ncbi:hypothetical protein CCP3SC15_1440003 [Gammaproteobacteria bacterium]
MAERVPTSRVTINIPKSSSSSGGSAGAGASSGSSPSTSGSSSSSSPTSRVTINLSTGGQSGVKLGSQTFTGKNEPTRTTSGQTVTRVSGGGSGGGSRAYVTSGGGLMNLTTQRPPTQAQVFTQEYGGAGVPAGATVVVTTKGQSAFEQLATADFSGYNRPSPITRNVAPGIQEAFYGTSAQQQKKIESWNTPPKVEGRYLLTNPRTGQTVDISKAANARAAFAQAGYSAPRQIGELTLQRPVRPVSSYRGRTGYRTGQEMQTAGSIKVYQKTVIAQNAAEARLAGLPSEGTYSILTDKRTYQERVSLLEKANKSVEGRIELAGQNRKVSIYGISKGIETFGRNVKEESTALEKGITPTQRDAGLLTRYSPKNLGIGALKVTGTTGSIIETLGKDIRERPVTFAAVAASGAAFKIADTGIVALRGSKALAGVGLLARGARGTITAGRATVIGGLGGAFIGQTGLELYSARGSTEKTGVVIARTAEDVAAFGLGAKAGRIGIETAKPIATAITKDLKVTGQELLASREGTIGGRSAKERAGRITATEQRQRKQGRDTQYKLAIEPLSPSQNVYTLSGKGIRRELKKTGEVNVKFTEDLKSRNDIKFNVVGKQLLNTDGKIEVQFKGIPFKPLATPRERFIRSQALAGLGKRVKLRGSEFIYAAKTMKPFSKQPQKVTLQSEATIERTTSSGVLLQQTKLETTNIYATVTRGEAAVRQPTRIIQFKGAQLPRVDRGQGYISESPTGFAPEVLSPQKIGRDPVRFGSPDYRRMLALERLRAKAAAQKAQLEQPAPVTLPSAQKVELKQPAKGKTAIRSSAASLERTLQGSPSVLREAQRPVNDQGLSLVQRSSFTTTQIPKIATGQAQATSLVTRQTPRLSTATDTTQRQEPQPTPIFDLTPRPRPRPPKEPTLTPVRLPRPTPRYFGKSITEKLLKTPKPQKNRAGPRGSGFNVLVRKKGKFSQVNRGLLGEAEALSLGKQTVQKSLAASFKVVTPSGKALSAAEGLPTLGGTFRTAKKDKSIFVQKAPFRLSSREERTSIQAAKKGFRGLRL